MTSVKKLKDDLDYWIHIGIGDDIYRVPESRPEYQHLVRYLKRREVKEARIPRLAHFLLSRELRKHPVCQPTFWRLNILCMKWGCKWVLKKVSRSQQIQAEKKEV